MGDNQIWKDFFGEGSRSFQGRAERAAVISERGQQQSVIVAIVNQPLAFFGCATQTKRAKETKKKTKKKRNGREKREASGQKLCSVRLVISGPRVSGGTASVERGGP